MKFSDYMDDSVDKRLADALIALMEKQEMDEISTSELLKLAGVSRSTFYRRYRDKYDLLNRGYQLILDKTLFTVYEGVSFKRVFIQLYTVLSMYPTVFKNALASNDHNSLRKYIFRTCYDVHADMMQTHGWDMKDVYNQLLLTGYLTGTLEITAIWADNGMKEPVEMIYKLIYRLMPDEIRTCISLYYT